MILNFHIQYSTSMYSIHVNTFAATVIKIRPSGSLDSGNTKCWIFNDAETQKK